MTVRADRQKTPGLVDAPGSRFCYTVSKNTRDEARSRQQKEITMSHGCVNLPTEEAEWLFGFADAGTLVNVHE